MAEEKVTQDVKTAQTDAVGVNNTADDSHKTESSVPYARFKEVNDKLRAREEKLAGISANQKSEKEKRMAEEGKKDELIASLTSERDSVVEKLGSATDRMVKIEDARRDELISRLPESLREKYNDKDKYSTDVLSDVVDDLGGSRANVSVDSSKPSSREFKSPNVSDFNADHKGLSSKQRQGKWTDFLKTRT